MQRLFLQFLAIVLVVLLVAALTLTLMGRISALAFWIVAGLVFLLSFAFYRNPR